MTRYIALLRGINVGGHRKILMKDLKVMFADMGFSNVVTYIQSGNVIFETNESTNRTSLEDHIKQHIKTVFGHDVPVVIRTVEDWQQAIAENPFFHDQEPEIDKLYITFLRSVPAKENVERLAAFDFGDDRYTLIGDRIYCYYGDKVHTSKLSNPMIENKLKVEATSRNWKTMKKLLELATT